jgi:hypothetical protein
MTKTKKTTRKTTAKAMVARLAKQAGEWAVETGTGYHDGTSAWSEGDAEWLRLTHDGVAIAFNLTVAKESWDRPYSFEGLLVEGHTTFDGGRSFTRHGVDTCSCRLATKKSEYDEHSYQSLAALLEGETARCVAARERAKTAVALPGLPFTRQPEWFPQTAARLREGRIVTLTPAGFGTGFHLSTRRSPGSVRATDGLELMLDVAPVYVSSFDHD